MAEVIKVDSTLDCKGLICPEPIVKTNMSIKKLQIGQVLVMESTDAGATSDMHSWAKRTGHQLLKEEQEGKVLKFYVKKMK
ncbi:MAG: sulfurtransferase TusA family protein [Nitrospinae bacterium]|nr:sulfurtransferase TusA family protein [Nitrospinota bacterium]